MRCIFCSQEIPDDQVKQHIAEVHLGIHLTDGEKPRDIDPPPSNEVTKSPSNEVTKLPETPTQKPKRCYLNAQEILDIIGHTNTKIPTEAPTRQKL
jgi:hypothetical protein